MRIAVNEVQKVKTRQSPLLSHSNLASSLLVLVLHVPECMATTPSLPGPSRESLLKSASVIESETASLVNEDALDLSSQQIDHSGILALNPRLAFLPVELDVSIPVREFLVRNLLALEAGQVIETRWAHGEDMPLAARDTQLAWSEFEVVESKLAVRITRLA